MRTVVQAGINQYGRHKYFQSCVEQICTSKGHCYGMETNPGQNSYNYKPDEEKHLNWSKLFKIPTSDGSMHKLMVRCHFICEFLSMPSSFTDSKETCMLEEEENSCMIGRSED